jgi:hypothetical protein
MGHVLLQVEQLLLLALPKQSTAGTTMSWASALSIAKRGQQ